MKLPYNLAELVPQPSATNVALNSIIVVKFVESFPISSFKILLRVEYKTQTQDFKQFPPVDLASIEICDGVLQSDKTTNSLTFIPSSLFVPHLEYTVHMSVESSDPTENFVYNWNFTTEPSLSSIRLLVHTNNNEKKSLISLGRQGNLLAELKAKVSAKLKVAPTLIGSILVGKVHEIRTERDVYLLKDSDTLQVSVLSPDQQLSTVFVHEELPRLSYDEYLSSSHYCQFSQGRYVKAHWAPKWAGFYVIGTSKDSEEEELKIIAALLRSAENQEFL